MLVALPSRLLSVEYRAENIATREAFGSVESSLMPVRTSRKFWSTNRRTRNINENLKNELPGECDPGSDVGMSLS